GRHHRPPPRPRPPAPPHPPPPSHPRPRRRPGRPGRRRRHRQHGHRRNHHHRRHPHHLALAPRPGRSRAAQRRPRPGRHPRRGRPRQTARRRPHRRPPRPAHPRPPPRPHTPPKEGCKRRCDTAGELGAERHEMSTHHSHRISRKAAEQLLGGAVVPGAGSDSLSRVLAAAAAPGHEPELAGEAKAVAAFQTRHLVSVTTPRRGQMIKSPVAKLLTAKALAAALAVFVTGGVALAASTGALSGPTSSQPSGTGQPASPPPATSSPGAPTGLANLCRSLASQVALLPSAQVSANIGSQAGLEQALASPELGQVVSGSSYAS